jgi:drug/metabolite transporter (DMT)-like permease
MPTRGIPYVAFLGFLFGSTLVVSRFSVGQFHPTTYIGLRMILASCGHIVFFAVTRRKWPTGFQLWKHATILGIFGTALPMTAIVTSLLYQSSGITAVLLTAGPAITVVMAHFGLMDEKLTWLKSAGIMLALGGALLITLRGESGLSDLRQGSPIGYGLVLFAMVAGSAMTIYARKFMRDFDAMQVASIRMFTAALTIMPLSILFVGFDLQSVNQSGYLALLYAALMGTFGGFILAFYNIKKFGATASAMTLYVVPIVAGFGGVMFLSETITTGIILGSSLIVFGVALINGR